MRQLSAPHAAMLSSLPSVCVSTEPVSPQPWAGSHLPVIHPGNKPNFHSLVCLLCFYCYSIEYWVSLDIFNRGRRKKLQVLCCLQELVKVLLVNIKFSWNLNWDWIHLLWTSHFSESWNKTKTFSCERQIPLLMNTKISFLLYTRFWCTPENPLH